MRAHLPLEVLIKPARNSVSCQVGIAIEILTLKVSEHQFAPALDKCVVQKGADCLGDVNGHRTFFYQRDIRILETDEVRIGLVEVEKRDSQEMGEGESSVASP